MPEPPRPRAAVEVLREKARALAPLVTSDLAWSFLAAVEELPSIGPRTLLRTKDRSRSYTREEAAALPESERSALEEAYYYTTHYGSPLAYVRPLELAAGAGVASVAGRRVLDYGFGTIGHLRLLASLGAEVTGIEVDPLLRALYSAPGDQGIIPGWKGPGGTLRLLHGFFPSDESVRRATGGGYDLIVSKNTLKKGFIHPVVPVGAAPDGEARCDRRRLPGGAPRGPGAGRQSAGLQPLTGAGPRRQAVHPLGRRANAFPALGGGVGAGMSSHPGVRLGGPFGIRPVDEEFTDLANARQR